MNALIDLGAWTLEQVRHVGRMAIFALQLFKELPASLARFGLWFSKFILSVTTPC